MRITILGLSLGLAAAVGASAAVRAQDQRRYDAALADVRQALSASQAARPAVAAAPRHIFLQPPATAPEPDVATPEADGSPELDTAREPPVEPRERLGELDGLFRQEPVDPAWSRSAESVLDRRAAAILPPGSRVDVACRSTVCTVVSEHEGASDFDRFASDLFLRYAPESPRGPVYMTPLEEGVDGRVKSIAYVLRHPES